MTHSAADGPVIDFGAHFHPKAPEKLVEIRKSIGMITEEPDEYVEWFHEGGYDGAVLSQPYFMGHEDARATAEANDELMEIIDHYDEFYGLAGIPVGAGGEAAAEEFERSLDAGYNGGALPTKTDGVELIDSEIEPVLEVADSTGAPLLVHPKLHESLHPDVLDDKYLLNAVYGREVALSESITKVIHTGVLDRYPNLNLVYHHLGGNIPAMLGRTHLQLDPGRWPGRQEHVKDYEEYRAQMEDRIYLDTSGHLSYTGPIRSALEALPSSQILLGTDAPYEPRSPAELRKFTMTIRECASREDARRVLGQNTLDLLVNL